MRDERGWEIRFWAKVDKTDDCWLWTGHVMRKGYGQFGVREGEIELAHRVAYRLLVGDPGSQQLDHRRTCPKRCVNPDHLRPVTNKQNSENRAGPNRNTTSGVRGVCWDKNRRKWHASLRHDGVKINVGRYNTIEEAAQAVAAKRCEVFTHSDMDMAS